MKSALTIPTIFTVCLSFILLSPTFSCEKVDELIKQLDTTHNEKPDTTKTDSLNIDTSLDCVKNNTADLYISNKDFYIQGATMDRDYYVYVFDGTNVKFGERTFNFPTSRAVKCFYDMKASVYQYEIYLQPVEKRDPLECYAKGEFRLKRCKDDTLYIK